MVKMVLKRVKKRQVTGVFFVVQFSQRFFKVANFNVPKPMKNRKR